MLILALSALTPTSATSAPPPNGGGGLARPPGDNLGVSSLALLDTFRRVVETENACALPGVSLKYGTFLPVMWGAVRAGWVAQRHAEFVSNGLRHGFDLGVDTRKLQGHRWFRNYGTAMQARDMVTAAVMSRVECGKTLLVGRWDKGLAAAWEAMFESSCIFPMGGTPKPLEPTKIRPTDDHTRTGVNAATDMAELRHTLNAYQEVAEFLRPGYFMRVSDVEAAFPLLPLSPYLWPFFAFRFFAQPTDPFQSLFVHLCADFGAAGTPGTFKIFFVEVVVNMARALKVLTLNMPVYVDDLALIGRYQAQVDREMLAFHAWAWDICGIVFKAIKDKPASQRQLMLGLWWDSRVFTRTLDERKLVSYVDMLAGLACATTLTLKELQVAGGRLQRAVLTLPPGASCLLVGLFTLMAGLTLPWHRRRVNKGFKEDMRWLHRLLSLNLGRGFYTYEHFPRAPEARSDASKSTAFSGGGWATRDGYYSFFKYGTRASRQPIDFLEGDTVVDMLQSNGERWRRHVVPAGIDNTAFQQSVAKGRSSAERLNVLVKEVFVEQVKHECILDTFWLSSEDNVVADHLSRDREALGLESAFTSGFWTPGVQPIKHARAGLVRVLPESRGGLHGLKDLRGMAQPSGSAPRPAASAPRRRTPGLKGHLKLIVLLGCVCPSACVGAGSSLSSSVPYSRASLFEGLPLQLEPRLETVLAHRLAPSSWRSVQAGLRLWRLTASRFDWPVVIPSDDPTRGGKLVAFVLGLVDDTSLVFKSIENYVWGLRTWQKLQRQADPVLGVMGWSDFMDSVKVLTWVPAEPRKAIPVAVVEAILDAADDSFKSVQLVFLILLLAYTFSRTECPLPKSHKGDEAFDPDAHWRVEDIELVWQLGKRCLRVRFRRIKQDRRVERPDAQGDGDWSYIGEIPASKWCPVEWYLKLVRLHGPRPLDGPFFVSPHNPAQAYLYGTAANHFKEAQVGVGVSKDETTGYHGLRVFGWNRTKEGLGSELAQAHGLWRSKAGCARYDRFKMSDVLTIPRVVALGRDADEVEPDDGLVERPVARGTRPARGAGSPLRADGTALVVAGDVDSTSPMLLPEGWDAVPGERHGRLAVAYRGPHGEVVATRVDAWIAQDATDREVGGN